MKMSDDDLISRKAAIEAMEKSEWGYLWECEQVINVVKDLPPTEPEQKWIPVSERLPEDTERYLVTLANGDIDIGWIRGDEYLWDLVDIDCEYFLSDKRYQVVAWMPLPKPYKKKRR